MVEHILSLVKDKGIFSRTGIATRPSLAKVDETNPSAILGSAFPDPYPPGANASNALESVPVPPSGLKACRTT
jgi:hypothetical protein